MHYNNVRNLATELYKVSNDMCPEKSVNFANKKIFGTEDLKYLNLYPAF